MERKVSKVIDELLNCLGDFTVSYQDKEIKFSGMLKKQERNVVLECQATPDTKSLAISQDEFQVYGTVVGTKVTLLECYVSSAKLIAPNFDKGTFILKPFEIVTGRNTKGQITATRISASIKELNWMFSTRALKTNYAFQKENPSLLDCTFPDPIIAQDDDGTIRIERFIRVLDEREICSFEVIPFIEFSFNSAVSIPDAVSKVASARNLLSFFSDYYLPLGELTFTDQEESNVNDCELYQNYEEEISIPSKPFLISSDVFQDNFQSIWDNWQKFYGENKNIAELFYEMISNHSLKTNRFLNLCQCLEIYSRCYRNEEAKKVKERESNKKQKVTLRHRIEDLLIETSPYLGITIEQCSALAETISNARNYYTHYDKKRTRPTFACISASSELLHFVLLLVVYLLLEVPQDAILKCKGFTPYKNMRYYIGDIK